MALLFFSAMGPHSARRASPVTSHTRPSLSSPQVCRGKKVKKPSGEPSAHGGPVYEVVVPSGTNNLFDHIPFEDR